MTLEEYRSFVKTCFIAEPNTEYNLLRAGLEFAEEYLEYSSAKTESQSRGEAGDLLFWTVAMTNMLKTNFYKCDEQNMAAEHLALSIIGSIKRYYRDGNMDKLCTLADLLNSFFHLLTGLYGQAELIDLNVAKLTRRLSNDTIQGEGER